jgi:hypothetical protein
MNILYRKVNIAGNQITRLLPPTALTQRVVQYTAAVSLYSPINVIESDLVQIFKANTMEQT